MESTVGTFTMAANIDKMIQEGELVPGSRADFAKFGVGIAVRRFAETGYFGCGIGKEKQSCMRGRSHTLPGRAAYSAASLSSADARSCKGIVKFLTAPQPHPVIVKSSMEPG
jgi:hypothetical protein